MSMSLLDANQTLRSSYDDTTSTFKMQLLNNFVPALYDTVSQTAPNSTTDVFTFKTGGTSGTTVATITIVYTDTTKATMSTAVRT